MSIRARWLLVAALVMSVNVFAQKNKVQDFVAPEAGAGKQKQKLGSFAEAPENRIPDEEPLPWKAISMTALAFLVAIPFAIGAYRKSAEEQEAARGANLPGSAGGKVPRRKQSDDE